MKEKVLVIGGSGSLGKQLIKDLSRDFNVKGTGTYFEHKEQGLIHLDITCKEEVDLIFKRENPDIVIVTAAKTNVEACESNLDETFRVNVNGIENIINNCDNKKVIFYSTDNVFDGTKRSYIEEDVPNPINVYGKSKLEGEKLVRTVSNHLICRSSRFYGSGKNHPKYLDKVISMLKGCQEVKAPIGTLGNFTFIPDISRATLELIKKNKTGTYHVAGSDYHSLYDAALTAAKVFGFDSSLVVQVDPNYFNSKVKRPSSPLDITKLKGEGIKMSTLEQGLEKIKGMII